MIVRRVPAALFPIAAVLLILSIAAPIVAVLSAVSLRDVLADFGSEPVREATRVSLLASTAATGIATIFGVPAGYWLARTRSRAGVAMLFVLALPLAFPPVASGIMLLYIFGAHAPLGEWLGSHGIGVVDSIGGVVAAEFFVSGSLVALAATAAFHSLDPLYEEAARTLGISEWRIFTRIALPAAANNVLAGVAFAWLRAIGEYGATSVVAYHPTTLPIALYVALSSSGVRAAVVLCYGFVLLAAAVVAIQWVLRRRVVV